MRTWLRAALLWALAGLLLGAGWLAVWSGLVMIVHPTQALSGSDFAEVWLSPLLFAGLWPEAVAARSLALALGGLVLVSAVLGLLLRWRDPDGMVLASLRWSLAVWLRGWPFIGLMLLMSLLLMWVPAPPAAEIAAYAIVIVWVLVLWLSCLHPSVVRTLNGGAWWRPQLPPIRRLLCFFGLLMAGGLFSSLAGRLLPPIADVMLGELQDSVAMLAATLCIISVGRSESARRIAFKALSADVLLRWLLMDALLLAVASVVAVPVLMLGFLGTQYGAQATANFAAAGSTPPLAFSMLMRLSSVDFMAWLPTLLAALSWTWLLQGRLLTVALGWEDRTNADGAPIRST